MIFKPIIGFMGEDVISKQLSPSPFPHTGLTRRVYQAIYNTVPGAALSYCDIEGGVVTDLITSLRAVG